MTSYYPNLRDFTLAVLLTAPPGGAITPAIVDAALAKRSTLTLTADTFESVILDLKAAHMIEGDEHRLTNLADRYACMWRAHFAKLAKG